MNTSESLTFASENVSVFGDAEEPKEKERENERRKRSVEDASQKLDESENAGVRSGFEGCGYIRG